MDINERIARFENMAQADPDNDMAHFSLGGAYAQADRHADAARSFLRCVELNPEMSKAYQLAGAELVKAGDRTEAARVLKEGYVVAARLGDRMPQTAMERLLGELGEDVPELDDATKAEAQRAASAAPGGFVCARTGRPGTKMKAPPFKGPIGAWIHENISAETFHEWIKQGTKVINELRLDLSREQDEKTYDQHMYEYLGLDESLLRDLREKQNA